MEIGLYAESAGLSSLGETLARARELGISRIELSTGGQNAEPFVDVDVLLESKSARRALLETIADHGYRSPRSMPARFRFIRDWAMHMSN